MPQPLDDICVIDLSSGPVGGTTTMVLGDFGAEVIKVERPGGDRFRTLPAAPMWLRGKRSLELDLTQAADREQLHRLVDGADVVVASFAPGKAAALGADYATLAARNPALIYSAITGWGPRGPYASYPAYEGLVAAKSGRMMAFSGQRDREGPAFAAVAIGSHAASQAAVQGIVAALMARERDGRGRLVETSLLQAMMSYDLLQMSLVQLTQRDPERYPDMPVVGGGMPTLNYHPVMAGDGRWIQLANLLEHLFIAFLQAVDLTDMLVEEKFQDPPALWSPEAIEDARDRILVRMQTRSAAEWMEVFQANGNVAAEPFTTAQEALEHPDIVANGDVVDLPHPELGTVRQLALIGQLTETPGRPGAAGSAVGADNAALLAEPARRPAATPDGGTPPPAGRPLDGITILEFATIIATPLAAAMLGDLGARVIKIEPIGGDPYRGMGPAGVMAAKVNAGKESICIDLKSEQGQALVTDLIRGADVIIHNYRPGVPERLGIGYEQARALRSDIVWVSANGYGPDCDSARRPSAHPVPGAVCGGALRQAGAAMPPVPSHSLTDLRESARQFMRANEANPDPNTSVVIASATLMALRARQRFGGGQQVFVNMLVANGYANGDDFLAYAGKHPRAEVDADLHGLSALYRLYPALQGWVFLAVITDDEWAALLGAIDAPAIAADARFASAEARRANDAALAEQLATLFQQRDADAWEQHLIAAGVGCVRADAATPGQFWALDAHVEANGFAPLTQHARLGSLRRWGSLVTVDGGPKSYGPGVLAGEQTDGLLAEIGRDAAEIARLRETGVVWSEPIELAPEPG